MRYLLLLIVASAAASAQAQVVNMDARVHCSSAGGAVQVKMDVGVYIVSPIRPPEGLYTALNAWGRVAGCDPTGVCENGWLHRYNVEAETLLMIGKTRIWSTPEQAFAEAQPVRLRICEAGTIRFYIPDPQCSDNLGGVSVRIDPDPCPADIDLNGSLDFFDFLAFQNLFAAGDPAADMDCSGDLDFFDFLAFQTLFARGC